MGNDKFKTEEIEVLYFDLDWIRGNIKDSEYALRERRYEAYLGCIKICIR